MNTKEYDYATCSRCGRDLEPEYHCYNCDFMESPIVVCLCGSTRFYDDFQKTNFEETMKGNIVLSVGFYLHSSEKAHGELYGITEKQKIMLDELHKRKIDLCDEILVINKDDYIGESTRGEIEYAKNHNKKIRYCYEHIEK